MTHEQRTELAEQIHGIIQVAVERSGGDWKRSYRHEVEHILALTTPLNPPTRPEHYPLIGPEPEHPTPTQGKLL